MEHKKNNAITKLNPFQVHLIMQFISILVWFVFHFRQASKWNERNVRVLLIQQQKNIKYKLMCDNNMHYCIAARLRIQRSILSFANKLSILLHFPINIWEFDIFLFRGNSPINFHIFNVFIFFFSFAYANLNKMMFSSMCFNLLFVSTFSPSDIEWIENRKIFFYLSFAKSHKNVLNQ